MNYSGDTGSYWTQDGIEVLCPTSNLVKSAVENNKPNISSSVLLLTHKGYKVLMDGDAEKDTWDYIMENYSDKIANINILKAAHHGRDTGFHEEAVKLMNPEFTIVPVAKSQKTMLITSIKNIQGRWFYQQDIEETLSFKLMMMVMEL